jgi:hypothetical protein
MYDRRHPFDPGEVRMRSIEVARSVMRGWAAAVKRQSWYRNENVDGQGTLELYSYHGGARQGSVSSWRRK